MTSRSIGVALATVFGLTAGNAFAQTLSHDRTAGHVNLTDSLRPLCAIGRSPAVGRGFRPKQRAQVGRESMGGGPMRAGRIQQAQGCRCWAGGHWELTLDVAPALPTRLHDHRDVGASTAQWTHPVNPQRSGLRYRPAKSAPGILVRRGSSADEELLKAIYGLGRPFDNVMIAADHSAWPLFVGAVPIAWVLAAVDRDRAVVRTALGIAMSEGVAAAATIGLKRLVARPRPYTAVTSIVARSAVHRDGRARDPHSFPSGHAALSFSLATAVALESQRWYITVPVFGWASAVSVSRVWLGVHYPTDVLAGAILGGATAIGMHALARSLIGDEGDNGVGTLHMTFVRLGF